MKPNEPAVIALLMKLAHSHPNSQIPEVSIRAYAEHLVDIPLDLLAGAVEKLCTEGKFFPALSEIIDGVQEIFEEEMDIPSADEAWDWVQSMMQYGGPSHEVAQNLEMANEAARVIGGWKQLGMGMVDDRKWVRKEFVKVYEALLKRMRSELRAGPVQRKLLNKPEHRTYLRPGRGMVRIGDVGTKAIGEGS